MAGFEDRVTGNDVVAVVPNTDGQHFVYLKTGEIVRVNPISGNVISAVMLPGREEIAKKQRK